MGLKFAPVKITLSCLLLMLPVAAFAADGMASAPHREELEEEGTMGCAAGVPLHPQFKSYSERLKAREQTPEESAPSALEKSPSEGKSDEGRPAPNFP